MDGYLFLVTSITVCVRQIFALQIYEYQINANRKLAHEDFIKPFIESESKSSILAIEIKSLSSNLSFNTAIVDSIWSCSELCRSKPKCRSFIIEK